MKTGGLGYQARLIKAANQLGRERMGVGVTHAGILHDENCPCGSHRGPCQCTPEIRLHLKSGVYEVDANGNAVHVRGTSGRGV